jgi:REP element-mobilizing transposase RayT
MDLILWSALGLAQSLYPIKIISFVVMGNHVHMIATVGDPTMIESFMERFKCETAHAVNRLLGRRQVTVWCEGYDSPTILTVDDLIDRIAYVYANPVRARLSAAISDYQGVSSWGMFTSGELVRDVKRIRRNFIVPVATGRVSPTVRKEEAFKVETKVKESLKFTLSPDSWQEAFPGQMTPERLNERVLQRIKEIESEVATTCERDGVKLPSNYDVASRPIDTPYAPKTFGKRMWCISSCLKIKIAFITLIKALRRECRRVRLEWLKGNLAEKFPPGMFPPALPIFANISPDYFKRAVSMA